ncbi:MAG: thioredoxin family protein [bacterium]|nr:MAG: thioredoxin family protein [bacterium]
MNNFVLVILGIIGLFVIFQFVMKFRSWSQRGKPAPRVGGSLGKSIIKGEKILAYFYSPNCRACKTQETYLPGVQEKFKNIFRVNAAKERDIASAFGIIGTPTTIVIENGIIKDYFVGITGVPKLLHSLELK